MSTARQDRPHCETFDVEPGVPTSTRHAAVAHAGLVCKVFRDGQLVDTVPVRASMLKIGRLPSSAVRLDDPAIGRMHAAIEIVGGRMRIIDLGSKTGTRVNGTQVIKHGALTTGDSIEVGPFVLELANTEAAQARRPVPAVEDTAAPQVAEIVTSYRGTVLDVTHVHRTAPRRRAPQVAVAIGLLTVAAGAGLFAHDVVQDWDGYAAAKAEAIELKQDEPAAPGWGVGGLGGLLALLGLVPLAAGLVYRRDQTRTSYRVGESPQADVHASLGQSAVADHGLVRGSQIALTSSMAGSLWVDGTHVDLASLHVQHDGLRRFELPRDGRCRIDAGPLTFHISAVAPGRAIVARNETDKAFWLSNGAALVGLGSLLALVNLVPPDAGDLAFDDELAMNRFVGYLQQPDTPPDPEPDVVDPDREGDAQAEGQESAAAAGDPGKMGDPSKTSTRGRTAVRGPADQKPTIGRTFNPVASAREAGILGMMETPEAGHFLAMNGASDPFSVGDDDLDVWGHLHDTEIGAAGGAAGLNLTSVGRGGGGDAEGTIGLGEVGLLNHVGHGDAGEALGNRPGVPFGKREAKRPRVRVPSGTVKCGVSSGCLDKATIRRVVRAHINEVRHCYNQGLTRDPNLRGRVAVTFRIDGRGKVLTAVVSDTSIDDAKVGRCVTGRVKHWRFPASGGTGSAMVTYPFVFHAS